MRLSDFKFDGPNLRWMAILACNGLRYENFESMRNKFVLPVGDEFHFICGGNSVLYSHAKIGSRWSYNMNVWNLPIWESWYTAGRKSYSEADPTNITDTVIYSVVGWSSTFNDRLRLYTEPDPSFDFIERDDNQVYP